jgi:hypothetical protein
MSKSSPRNRKSKGLRTSTVARWFFTPTLPLGNTRNAGEKTVWFFRGNGLLTPADFDPAKRAKSLRPAKPPERREISDRYLTGREATERI